jgi:hypothetical protein
MCDLECDYQSLRETYSLFRVYVISALKMEAVPSCETFLSGLHGVIRE